MNHKTSIENEENPVRTYVANRTRETKQPNTLTSADIGKYEGSHAHKRLKNKEKKGANDT